MKQECIDFPFVIFGSNANGSERYAVFSEDGVVFSDSPFDATRFRTARDAYSRAQEKMPNSAVLKHKILQDCRVGRRTY